MYERGTPVNPKRDTRHRTSSMVRFVLHFIIEIIWWTGLAPWEIESPFPGGLMSTFLHQAQDQLDGEIRAPLHHRDNLVDHGRLNSLFQVALCLPSYTRHRISSMARLVLLEASDLDIILAALPLATRRQPSTLNLHPSPFTLHHSPFTLHPTPYTLHPAP